MLAYQIAQTFAQSGATRNLAPARVSMRLSDLYHARPEPFPSLTASLPSASLTRLDATLMLSPDAPVLVYHFACRVARLQRDCERMGGASMPV